MENPPKSIARGNMRPRILNFSRTATVLMMILACALPGQLLAENYLASPEAFIQRFGPPDAIETTENDHPRPFFVTKTLSYKKERVQFIFVADAKPGDQPPFQKWLPMGAIDTRKKVSLDPDTALKRLAHRRRP